MKRADKGTQPVGLPASTSPQADKPLYVLHGAISTPPMSSKARVEIGYHLRRLQQGEKLSLPLSRPLPGVGAGCHELGISDLAQGADWRVMYCIDELAILVLDVFKKETQQTPESVKNACRERLSRYEQAKQRK
jgi:phage-related protein